MYKNMKTNEHKIVKRIVLIWAIVYNVVIIHSVWVSTEEIMIWTSNEEESKHMEYK